MSLAPPIKLPHLYRHCLESILAFCDITELRCALQWSREWLAAVYTMRPIAGTVRLRSLCAVLPSSRSPLFRHVHSLRGPDVTDGCPCLMEMQWADLHRDGPLASFSALHSLRCFNQRDVTPADRAVPSQLPPTLRSLEICIDNNLFSYLSARRVWVLDLIAQIPQLECLTLHDAAWLSSLRGVVGMSSLRHLTLLRQSPHFAFLAAVVRELRFMSQLSSLTVTDMSSFLLNAILAPGHQCKWTSIPVTASPLDCGPALASLPTLTDLRLRLGRSSLAFLTALPQLTHLELWMGSCPVDKPVPDFDALQSCTQLRTLVFNRYRLLSAVSLGAAVLRMPLLSSLRITGARSLDSLAFLGSAAMVRSLTDLEIRGCVRIPVSDVELLRGLKALRSLSLDRSLTSELNESALSGLRPPSALLPALESFSYISPNHPPRQRVDHKRLANERKLRQNGGAFSGPVLKSPY